MTFGALIVDNRPIQDAIDRHKRFIPDNWPIIHLSPEINSLHDYNKFMVSRDLWTYMPDKVLVFQHDSGILRNGIEQFLGYYYVGAPWAWQEWGGNGGLSLRDTSAMLKVIDNFKWDGLNEDHWFCNGMKELGLNIAPRKICEQFSVEACFKLGAWGYHAIDKYLTPEQCNQIMHQYD